MHHWFPCQSVWQATITIIMFTRRNSTTTTRYRISSKCLGIVLLKHVLFEYRHWIWMWPGMWTSCSVVHSHLICKLWLQEVSNQLCSDIYAKASLDSEHVSDAVITLSLLEDHLSCNATLIIPHEGDQSDWLTAAIEQRNNHIRVAGQPKISHYCLKCMCIYTDLLTGRSKHLSGRSHTQPKECPTSTQKDSK